MLKKTGLILLALMLAAGMVFVGCTGNSGPGSEWEITSGFTLEGHGSQLSSITVSDKTVKMTEDSVSFMGFGIVFPKEANPDGYTWDMYTSVTVDMEITARTKGEAKFIIKTNGNMNDDATMVDGGNKYPQIGNGTSVGHKITTDHISTSTLTDRVAFQHNSAGNSDIDYTVRINKITFYP